MRRSGWCTLLLLRFVSMDLAESGIVVLAIYREGELATNDPRIGLLAEVARVSAAERLDPPGLTVEEVAHYIRSAGSDRPPEGLAEAVHRETEGNPLFVGEIVRMLAEEGRLGRAPDAPDQPLGVTEGVKAVIGRRLARFERSLSGAPGPSIGHRRRDPHRSGGRARGTPREPRSWRASTRPSRRTS